MKEYQKYLNEVVRSSKISKVQKVKYEFDIIAKKDSKDPRGFRKGEVLSTNETLKDIKYVIKHGFEISRGHGVNTFIRPENMTIMIKKTIVYEPEVIDIDQINNLK